MFNHRIRILSSLLIAFIIVNFYGRLSKTPFITPTQASNIKGLLSNIKFNPNSLVKFFTIKFDSKDTELVSRLDDRKNSFNLPTIPPSLMTSTMVSPTLPDVILTKGGTTKIPTKVPTKVPTKTPTKVPKPTKIPKPTPFNLSNPRPGKNFRESADIVGKLICIPPAMIMATLANEYGAWMAKVESDWTSRNTYKGSDPHDNAGSSIVPFVNVMQMMEDTWHRIKPILASKLGTNEISLEVTFDSMVAGAYHLRNISLAMHDKISCDDWPVKYILYGACRYNGACAAGSHNYNAYSYSVCNAYNRYTTGPKKNCK